MTLWLAVETTVLVGTLVTVVVLAQRVARLEERVERHSGRLRDMERIRLREVARREQEQREAERAAERH